LEKVMTPPGAEENHSAPETRMAHGPRKLRAVEAAEAEPASHTSERPLHNLPVELSSFVGREKELAEAKRLLGNCRLLTLTGSGGCGKTRLALAAARKLVGGFEGGVWMVELAPLADPSLLPQAAASVLGVREQPGRSTTETLADYLGSKRVLLILDNCEHLIEGCAALAEVLLHSCPGLRVLTTSREVLGITGEVAWPVPPLSLPDIRRLADVQSLPRYGSASLFVERARAVKPTFALTDQNAAAVARVCYRLEGIPLAIELAAARTKVLAVEEISERLDNCFGLLTGGGRTAMPRHRTLRATMDWSHELLTEEERILFRRLSVFVGGFTLEAAESACAVDGYERGETLELLSHLVDKSLVTAREEGGATRYHLLEMVRQYGGEKLDDSGEGAEVGRRYAGFYLGVAEEAERELSGPDQRWWLVRLEGEHGNLRAALSWSLSEGGDAGLGLRLAGALWPFWFARGYVSEGRRWLERAVSQSSRAAPHARAKALNGAGWLATCQEEYGAAKALIEEGLALYRELGDKEGVASSIAYLGFVAVLGHRDDIPVTALLEEAAGLKRDLEDRRTVANLVVLEGFLALGQGDLEKVVALNEEGLELYREARDDAGVVACLTNLGLVTLAQGDYERSTALLREGLCLAWSLDHKLYVQYGFIGLGGVAASLGWPIRAARLWGVSEGMSETFGTQFASAGRSLIDFEGRLAAARSRLGEAAWATAWAEGRAMDPEQAVGYALEQEPRPEPVAPESYPAGLSAREVDILRLVAGGMTNAGVASELFLSTRTVEWHLGSIYRKLGFHSRTEATRFAVEHELL
jgi:predicted ATPase/DNA-binding CsgD family transcriptional regulator